MFDDGEGEKNENANPSSRRPRIGRARNFNENKVKYIFRPNYLSKLDRRRISFIQRSREVTDSEINYAARSR